MAEPGHRRGELLAQSQLLELQLPSSKPSPLQNIVWRTVEREGMLGMEKRIRLTLN